MLDANLSQESIDHACSFCGENHIPGIKLVTEYKELQERIILSKSSRKRGLSSLNSLLVQENVEFGIDCFLQLSSGLFSIVTRTFLLDRNKMSIK